MQNTICLLETGREEAGNNGYKGNYSLIVQGESVAGIPHRAPLSACKRPRNCVQNIAMLVSILGVLSYRCFIQTQPAWSSRVWVNESLVFCRLY